MPPRIKMGFFIPDCLSIVPSSAVATARISTNGSFSRAFATIVASCPYASAFTTAIMFFLTSLKTFCAFSTSLSV